MKKILFIGLVLISFILNGQMIPSRSIKFVEESLLKDAGKKVELYEFNKRDFSHIWMKNQEAIIGYIGVDFQRIQIHFISIIKNQHIDNEYFVYGKSKVKNNVCDFQGKFIITHIRNFNTAEIEALYKEALKHGDKDAIRRFGKERCFILAKCFLYEDQEQKGSGVFVGVIKSYFYIENGVLFYDDLDLGVKDDYANNQFIGVWQNYKTLVQKPCSWGEYRIHNAGDLDTGVGEFSPNTKYLDKGWYTYYQAYNKFDNEAIKKENIKWWE